MATRDRVGIVVPACDEEMLIPGCLEAIGRAATGHSATVVVVLDHCRDDTERVCRRWGAETVRIEARNVGRARAAGAAFLMAGGAEGLWLAHTDADSRVAPDWLDQQAELAACGADAVFGVVKLAEEERAQNALHQSLYQRRIRSDGWHDHVHAASMGLTAAAYLAAGGFPPLAVHEDRHLAHRLAAVECLTVVYSDRVWVETSCRLDSRCDGGFASDLVASLSA